MTCLNNSQHKKPDEHKHCFEISGTTIVIQQYPWVQWMTKSQARQILPCSVTYTVVGRVYSFIQSILDCRSFSKVQDQVTYIYAAQFPVVPSETAKHKISPRILITMPTQKAAWGPSFYGAPSHQWAWAQGPLERGHRVTPSSQAVPHGPRGSLTQAAPPHGPRGPPSLASPSPLFAPGPRALLPQDWGCWSSHHFKHRMRKHRRCLFLSMDLL